MLSSLQFKTHAVVRLLLLVDTGIYPNKHVVQVVEEILQLMQLLTKHDVHLFVVLVFT